MTKRFTLVALLLALLSNSAAAQAPAPPTPQAPPTAFANLQLPTWLRVGLEYRGRLEGFTGGGFSPDREDVYWLNRFRITSRLTPRPWFTAAIQVQDARIEGRNGLISGAPFRDLFDLRIAYADVGSFERSRIAIRAGRQELAFGDQRLVGHANWLNTARSFDGARAVFRRKALRVDAFASSVVNTMMDDFNRSGGGNLFYGLDAPLSVLPNSGVIEPYEFIRTASNLRTEGGTAGDLTSWTTGTRLAGRFSPKTDYNAEVALQRGSLGTDGIRAWAGHGLVGRSVPLGGLTYRIVGEYNYASGDASATDGTRGTFDQLYPTAHDKYGLADQVGWKNIHHLRTGIEVRPQQRILLSGSYHSFWLARATDALYNAAGVPIARIAAGAPARHVGQELDIQLVYTPAARVQVSGGYAHLFTGAFLKAATPGKTYRYPYVMITTMLLGMER